MHSMFHAFNLHGIRTFSPCHEQSAIGWRSKIRSEHSFALFSLVFLFYLILKVSHMEFIEFFYMCSSWKIVRLYVNCNTSSTWKKLLEKWNIFLHHMLANTNISVKNFSSLPPLQLVLCWVNLMFGFLEEVWVALSFHNFHWNMLVVRRGGLWESGSEIVEHGIQITVHA